MAKATDGNPRRARRPAEQRAGERVGERAMERPGAAEAQAGPAWDWVLDAARNAAFAGDHAEARHLLDLAERLILADAAAGHDADAAQERLVEAHRALWWLRWPTCDTLH